MFDGDMVAGPVTGVAGVEHDPGPNGANRCAVPGPEVNSSVIARPAAELTKGGAMTAPGTGATTAAAAAGSRRCPAIPGPGSAVDEAA